MQLARAYIEITNLCNRNCSFCPGTARAPQVMAPECFRQIAQRLRAYTSYLCLHVMGEPLTHPQLEEILAISQELGFHVILTTNGTLLQQQQALLLNSPALHKVQISLQSFEANEGTMAQPYIRACAAFACAAAEKGIFCTMRLWNLDGRNTDGAHERNPELLRLLEQEIPKPWTMNTRGWRLRDRIFLEWGEKFDWPELTRIDGSDRRTCYALRRQIAVLVDGTVVPCCLDRNGDIALGRLPEQSMEEIMHSPRAAALLTGFAHKTAAELLCRSCGFAERFRI